MSRHVDSRVPVVCLECGRRFATASADPRCPACRGVDVDVDYTSVRRPMPFVDVQHEHHADGVTVTLSRVVRVF